MCNLRSQTTVRRVLIDDGAVSERGVRFQSLIDRPAKVQAGSGDYVQVLEAVQTNVTDVEHARIRVLVSMAAGAGTKRKPKGITQAQRPDFDGAERGLDGSKNGLPGTPSPVSGSRRTIFPLNELNICARKAPTFSLTE